MPIRGKWICDSCLTTKVCTCLKTTSLSFSDDTDALNKAFNYGDESGPLADGDNLEPPGDMGGLGGFASACARFVGVQAIAEFGKKAVEESDDNDVTFDRSSALMQSQESSKNLAAATSFSSGQ